MNIEINEEEVKNLIEKTVVSRVNSIIDKYFNTDGKYLFNDQVIERKIRDSIDSRVWDIESSKFDEAIKTFDKKELCESLAQKIYEQLFEY